MVLLEEELVEVLGVDEELLVLEELSVKLEELSVELEELSVEQEELSELLEELSEELLEELLNGSTAYLEESLPPLFKLPPVGGKLFLAT